MKGNEKCKNWGGFGGYGSPKVNGNIAIWWSAYDFLFDSNRSPIKIGHFRRKTRYNYAMHSIKWQCFRWPWVTPNHANHPNFCIFRRLQNAQQSNLPWQKCNRTLAGRMCWDDEYHTNYLRNTSGNDKYNSRHWWINSASSPVAYFGTSSSGTDWTWLIKNDLHLLLLFFITRQYNYTELPNPTLA